jgi:3-hydroxyisobutyrate dehydrogenase
MSHIAMLGLGAMGRRMARRLLDAGHELTVWNRTLGAADELVAAGARSAPTPRAAADGAQIVWAMVFDDVASRCVWTMPVLSPAAAGAGTLMLIGDYTPQAPVDLIAKDLGYAIDAAESASVALPLTAATQRRFEAARIAGLGAENLVAITKLYR